MIKIIFSLLPFLVVTRADPGFYGGHGFGPLLGHALPAPVLPAPTIIKSPIIAHAPAIAPAPILAPAPIYKAVAPASSYATVTQVHVTHPAVVKAVVAPQPIVKTIAYPAHFPAYGHGFH